MPGSAERLLGSLSEAEQALGAPGEFNDEEMCS